MDMFDTDAFNRTLFFPRRDVSEPPPGAIDHVVDVDDAALHLRIHGRSDATNPTVLFFHGNAETVADYDHAAQSFAGIGAALAVVDYRGYGRSTGTPTLRTLITDAHDVLAAVLERVEGDLIVMGRSIGSACANELYGSAELGVDVSSQERVVGFVLESGFTSIPRMAERRAMTAPKDFDPLFDPIPKLRRGSQKGRPLLILHGARDTLVRPDEAVDAHVAAPHAQLVMIEGRGHNDISVAPEYWRALSAFVRELARD